MKQRLIGAIVLVSLAVIFIPIILEGPDDEWTPRSHSIPEQPQMDYRADLELELPPEIPASDTQAVRETISAESATAPEPAKATPAVSTPPPVSAPAPKKSVPKPATSPPARAATAVTQTLQGWFVQVGSFGQEMNAAGLRDRLEAAGFKVSLQTVELGKKYAYRVLVGPAGSRAEADQLAGKLRSGQQLKGMVIEYPG